MVSKDTAEHYTWGAGCDGWRLLDRPELSIIHERMPSGTAEVRHYHDSARQFFFVLEGTLTLEIAGARVALQARQGTEVPPGVPHQAFNDAAQAAEFLVISHPTTRGDRVPAEEPRTYERVNG